MRARKNLGTPALLLAASASALVAAPALFGCSRPSPSPEGTSLASAVAPVKETPLASSARTLDAEAAKPFGAACASDSECAGTVCFHKRIKGADAGREHRGGDEAVEHDGYCSLRCNDDADCPVPPTKGRCGARGMCKRPD